jgi:hypothetical protein
MLLALETGIPKQYWQDAEDVMTALEILKERKGGR